MASPTIPVSVWRGPRILNNGSLYLQTADTLDFTNFTLASSGLKVSITASASTITGTLPVANGGTGATTASGARTNLGLAIGTDVQAQNADLQKIAGATAWSSYVPSITPAAGAFTTASATGAYLQIGKIVAFRAHLTITTNGTAATGISLGIPVSAKAGVIQSASVVESAVVGIVGGGRIDPSATIVFIQRYDATYLGGDGYVINVNGVYEAA